MSFQETLDQLNNLDFNDIDFSNVGSWPLVAKIVILVALLGAILGGGYFFHLTEKRDSLEAKEAEELVLKEEYESKRFQASNLDAYRKQRDEMEATFGALLRQLPSDTEVPGLIEDITRTALDNDLEIQSIDLQNEQRTEFYIELPIRVVVEGDYHKIGSFVSGVANLSRIVTLHDFDIRPQGGPSALRMSIVAKTYRYLEDEV